MNNATDNTSNPAGTQTGPQANPQTDKPYTVRIDPSRRLVHQSPVPIGDWPFTLMLASTIHVWYGWLFGTPETTALLATVQPPAMADRCNHGSQQCGLLRWCDQCGHVLYGQDMIGVDPEQYKALIRAKVEWDEVAVYLRENYGDEIRQQEHVGLSDSQVVKRYLSRERWRNSRVQAMGQE